MVIVHEIVSTVKNTLRRFSLHVLILLFFFGGVSGTASALWFSPISNIQGNIIEMLSTNQNVSSGTLNMTINIMDNYPVHNINKNKNYSTIQSAIDDSGKDDVIIVESGTYYENVNVNKRLILRGIGMPVVDANGTGSAIKLAENGIFLEGFAATGSGLYPDAGIKVTSNNNILTGNNASNNDYGIFLYISNNNILTGNNAESNDQNGIYLYKSHNNVVIGNNANSNINYYGIYLDNSNNNNLSDNNAMYNDYGLYMKYSNDSILTGNKVISNNGGGIYVDFFNNNTLIYNNVFNNSENFFFKGSYSSIWNTTIIPGNNIVYGPYIGGNFWAKPDGSGFSQNCEDNNSDYICDMSYDLDPDNIDYLPLILHETPGIFTVTIYPNSSVAGNMSAFMNFAANDSSNTTTWYNITFPEGFDASNANVNLVINGSDNPVNWINSISTHYVNISSNNAKITANSNMVQYVNLSTISVASTRGYYHINITTSNRITASLNYSIDEYGVNLTNISQLTNTTTTGTNATYYLNLENNGTDQDNYTLIVTQGGASVASINETYVSLNPGESRVLMLNVTNNFAGIFSVDVRAISEGDNNKVAQINFITTVLALRGINLTNISELSNTTISGINATYYLNLENNGTDQDNYTLIVDQGGASVASINETYVSLNPGESRVLMLNVTNNFAGIFSVNVRAISEGDNNKVAQINFITTVLALGGINLTNISELSNTTISGINATYYLNLENNGTDQDNYTLIVTQGGASVASINETYVSLNPGESRVLMLNVTNNFAGIFSVNVRAISEGDNNKVAQINFITTVLALRGINLTNISELSNTTISGINATYYLNLENNGTDQDNYTLIVTQGGAWGASVASINETYVSLNPGESRVLMLNVTNNFAGIFSVNVRAISEGDNNKVAQINTMTTVRAYSTDTSYWGNLTVGGILVSARINVTAPDGSDVGNTTSLANGSYNVQVKRNDNTPGGQGVSEGQIITFKVNGVAVLSKTVDPSGSHNRLDLSLYNGTLAGSLLKNGTNIGISEATVNITDITLGSSKILTTDTLGTYRVSLYPSTYTITVSKTGYSNISTTTTVVSNTSTSAIILLSLNSVTVTSDRIVGSADQGQNVTFNLKVVNTGENATFIIDKSMNAGTIVTTTPSMIELNASNSTGYVIVEVNNSDFGGWPVTITVFNSSQSKSASITLNAIMRDSSALYTNVSSIVEAGSNVTGATLVNTTVDNNSTVSGNSTIIMDSNVTGQRTEITNGTVIKGTYDRSYIDNSTIGSSIVDSSNLTDSIALNNAQITNSTLTDAIIDNSTLNNVTANNGVTVMDVVGLDNITLNDVTVKGDPNYEYEGKISEGFGWVNYQTINFTKIYTDVRISQLVIEQSGDIPVTANISIALNDTSIGKSMNFSMTVNLSKFMLINISETFINPDGAGVSYGTQIGNFLVIRSNDTNRTNVRNHTLRLYFDTDPATFNWDVNINYYNTSASAWEVLATTARGNESGRWYIEAVPNHFSTFALVKNTMTPTITTPYGSGDGSDGGLVTSEPYDNIERSETYEKNLFSNIPTRYSFKLTELGIYEIAVTGKESENNIALRVEVLKGRTNITGIATPPGTVYKNVNIWSGSKNILKGQIKFKVENSWISNNNVESGDLALVKWNGSQWVKLVTLETMKDDIYSFYEANTDRFSSFAITALNGTVVPTATPMAQDIDKAGIPVKPEVIGNQTPVPTKETPGFEAIIVVFELAFLTVSLRQYMKSQK